VAAVSLPLSSLSLYPNHSPVRYRFFSFTTA